MGQLSNEEIYRVRAAATDQWVVYRDTVEEPVASFTDKASALAYALHLARTHGDPIEYASNVTGRQFGAHGGRAEAAQRHDHFLAASNGGFLGS